MALSPQHYRALERFARSPGIGKGALFLDLDGVALVEERGSVFVSREVEQGIRDVARLIGWPVVINSLRFPLSIMRSIGPAWLDMYSSDIPAVLLNGGLIGRFKKDSGGMRFEESKAFPMTRSEVGKIMDGISDVIAGGERELAFFFYPRDWRRGEIVWVMEGTRVEDVRHKYTSASEVVAWSLPELREELERCEPVMALLLVNLTKDKRMAYQHTSSWDFFTREGVDKASGARSIAEMLGISLLDSIGGGDTEMDRFLAEVGMAVRVGGNKVAYKGVRQTLDVERPADLGLLVSSFAAYAVVQSAERSET